LAISGCMNAAILVCPWSVNSIAPAMLNPSKNWSAAETHLPFLDSIVPSGEQKS
jgi:hypothetical protein